MSRRPVSTWPRSSTTRDGRRPGATGADVPQRADLLDGLTGYLRGHREELYALSARAGATLFDARFDLDGGLEVVKSYVALGRTELHDATYFVEDAARPLGRAKGTFLGQHVCVPLRGAAVQINAFNFPVWGPLEKLAHSLLAGVPSVIKPATPTAYVTARLVELIVATDALPRGVVQLVSGGVGDLLRVAAVDADDTRGASLSPVLLHCADPDLEEPHSVQAFGPVCTVLPYASVEHIVNLAARGRGSLAGSLVTADPEIARRIVLELAPWHGRVLVQTTAKAEESPGHGSPLPTLVHGGPGRAGGGEELGGVRGVLHHMQRTAVEADPEVLAALTGQMQS